MAGLVYEVLSEYPDTQVEVKVIPGITAASWAAAVLGAPLTTDFAVISLSDLRPHGRTSKAVRLAAEAGFVMAIYNPASKKRADYLKKACRIVSEYLPAGNPLRLCAQHRAGGAGIGGADPERALGVSGGHVHHRYHRQQDHQGDRREARHPAGISRSGRGRIKENPDGAILSESGKVVPGSGGRCPHLPVNWVLQ